MRPDTSKINDPSLVRNSSSSCNSTWYNQTWGMSSFANRVWNHIYTPAQPWHSPIRSEYAMLAAVQDEKARAINATTYGACLTALGLSPSGHPNPDANLFLGGLLDTNGANYVLSSNYGAPNLPKAIFAATLQRAHDFILNEALGFFQTATNDAVFASVIDIEGFNPGYGCYVDPITETCTWEGIEAYSLMQGDWYHFGWVVGPAYPYPVQFDNVHLQESIATSLFWNMYDKGTWDIKNWFTTYSSTSLGGLHDGIHKCLPKNIFWGPLQYPMECLVC